ncbi:MAG: hypothetical protein ACOYOJ_09765 [Alsobacter sp.]
MRRAAIVTALVLAVASSVAMVGPAAAQALGAPAMTTPAEARPAAAAKPKPAARAAKPTPKVQKTAAGKPAAKPADGRKWEDLPMPKPKNKPEDFEWPSGSGGVRPTVGSGGGGMAIGF